MGRLRGVDTVLLDLDGTLYEGSQPVAGAADAVRALRRDELALRFTTNTDSIPPGAITARLAGLGIPTAADELVTPVALAGSLLSSTPGARALIIAAPAVRDELARWLATPHEPVTHVLVADPSYGATYAELDRAFRAVRAGAELIATQVNQIARRDDGEHLDTGGWVRLLEYATGIQARVLGKPSPDFFLLALATLARTPATAVVVGDDLAGDIGGAQAVGAAAVLVRTGKGGQQQPDVGAKPDAVIDSVADLPELLRAER